MNGRKGRNIKWVNIYIYRFVKYCELRADGRQILDKLNEKKGTGSFIHLVFFLRLTFLLFLRIHLFTSLRKVILPRHVLRLCDGLLRRV